jgi:hypothetical protein
MAVLGPVSYAEGMANIHEPARETPICHDCDVCVIGGSCTGVFAAIAAARRGARVALVEALGYFGGTATASLVCVWHSSFDTEGRLPIYAGLTHEVLDRLKLRGEMEDRGPGPDAQFVFSPAGLAMELDRMVTDAKVRPFLHARFVAPVLEDGRLAAAIIEDKSGRRAIRARYFVDATGDGDVAHRAGLECYRQPVLQPPTLCGLFEGYAEGSQRQVQAAIRRETFNSSHPEALARGFLWSAVLPGGRQLMIAGTRVHGANCSDADVLTAAEIEGRRQLRAIQDIARRAVGGCERMSLAAIPATIGVRQTRQVRCAHRLTQEEVLEGVRFEDAIANGSYRVDVHSGAGEGLIFRYLDGREVLLQADGAKQETRWRAARPQSPTFYQVPYRSLLPLGTRNLLVAGRCLDADEGAFGAVRVMVNCNQTGEAAGAAAALALESGADVGSVDAAALRESLRGGGAVII